MDNKVLLPLRIIITQDEEVTNSIIKATNRQTEVAEDQLFALSSFQKKLEDFFASFDGKKKIFYERRSRQYNSIQEVEKTRVTTMGNLLRSFSSMFLGEPHRTTKNYSSLLPRIGKTIFANDHVLEAYYLSAYALYKLEYLFRSRSIDAKYKPARWHILHTARMIGSMRELPPMNSNKMKRECDEFMKILWDDVQSKEMFDKCIELINKAAGEEIHRYDIRTIAFTEKLNKEISKVVEAGI